MTAYAYHRRDLLEEPEKYEYTEVHDEGFFAEHGAVRRQALRTLGSADIASESVSTASPPGFRQAAAEIASRLAEAGHEHPATAPSASETGVAVDTGVILSGLLHRYLEHPERLDEADSQTLRQLVGRYEIQKRLYRMYDVTDGRFRGSGDERASMREYATLYLLSGLEFMRTDSLVHLNCCLKLGDLVCSAPWRFQEEGTVTRTLAATGLLVELAAVRQLVARQEIEVPEDSGESDAVVSPETGGNR